MNKELENWFRANDAKIKESVNEIAKGNNLAVTFKGYYIEDNNLTGTGAPRPLYNDYEDYISQHPYYEITHVRYFFDFKKENEKHTVTVILTKGDHFNLSFSVEELWGGFDYYEPGKLLSSDFSSLGRSVKSKFNN